MERITRIKSDNFTMVDNTILRNKELSFKAKGLLSVIMALPPNWDFSINGIVAISKEGREAVLNTIRELIIFRYCHKEEIRSEGRFCGVNYAFYERPEDNKNEVIKLKPKKTRIPKTANPITVQPITVNPIQLSTYSINKETIKKESTPHFSKNEISEKNEILKQEPKTLSLNENDVCFEGVGLATLNDKVTDQKGLEIETNPNNNLKSTETVSESTNASKAICLYSEVAKMALNSYNEIANRNYTFQRHGEVIIKRLKAEFTKEQIQDPNTFELIKTMLEVKWQDTTPDNKGFAQLPLKNYEISTLFSPSKFKTYMQAAENTLTEKQKRQEKAAENKKTNIFDSII